MSHVSLESCFADGAGFSGQGQCCNQQVYRTAALAGGRRTGVAWRSPTGVVLTGSDKSLHLWFSASSTGKWGVSVRGSLRLLPTHWASLAAQTESCNAGDLGLIPMSGRYPREGNGNPLQSSCLENSMDRGAWRATVQGVTKSQTRLSN